MIFKGNILWMKRGVSLEISKNREFGIGFPDELGY
jgi:hypothetical protein